MDRVAQPQKHEVLMSSLPIASIRTKRERAHAELQKKTARGSARATGQQSDTGQRLSCVVPVVLQSFCAAFKMTIKQFLTTGHYYEAQFAIPSEKFVASYAH